VIGIVRAGALTTVQDLGRPGLAHLGVGRSGAADPGSLRLANRLVGNREGAACLEITFGNLEAQFHQAATVALAGAPCPISVSGRERFMHGPIQLIQGDRLTVGAPTAGVRTYLAVAAVPGQPGKQPGGDPADRPDARPLPAGRAGVGGDGVRGGAGAAQRASRGLPRRSPVTGGYPVIAVVVEPNICLAAQARPGQPVRFRLERR
jgi:allophanate hydrolase subunit 2